MAKQQNSTVLGLLAWITGVVVSLVVGFGMINGTLILPGWLGGGTGFGNGLVIAVGWIVLITTIISAILAVLKK